MLVLAASMAAVSGCGSDKSDAKTAAKAEVKTVGMAEATTTFQAAVEKFDTDGGCLEPEPGTCWEQMLALWERADVLRQAMRAEKSVGAEFWTEAYALLNTMEKGFKVGQDLGATAIGTNRPDVLGSAHDLADWLDAHPVS